MNQDGPQNIYSLEHLERLLRLGQVGLNVLRDYITNRHCQINAIYQHEGQSVTLYDYLRLKEKPQEAQAIYTQFGARSYDDFLRATFIEARNNNWDAVFFYLHQGVSPLITVDNWTLMHFACFFRNPYVVQVLRDVYGLGIMSLLQAEQDYPERRGFVQFYGEQLSHQFPAIHPVLQETVGIHLLDRANDQPYYPAFDSQRRSYGPISPLWAIIPGTRNRPT